MSSVEQQRAIDQANSGGNQGSSTANASADTGMLSSVTTKHLALAALVIIVAAIIAAWKMGWLNSDDDGGKKAESDDGDDGDGDDPSGGAGEIEEHRREHQEKNDARKNGHDEKVEQVDLPSDPEEPLKDDQVLIEGIVTE